jgi:hypothetical protein
VADFRAAVLDFEALDFEPADFFVLPDGDFLAEVDEALPELLLPAAFFFVVDLVWVAAAPEGFCVVSSLCLAGAGVTAKTAARIGARKRDSVAAVGEKKTECIIPL